MQSALKIRFLLVGCLLMVAVLSAIQFYLIRNSYELTKRQYYAEVKEALGNLSQPFTDRANSRAMHLLREQLHPDGTNTRRREFLNTIRSVIIMAGQQDDSIFHALMKNNKLLSGVRFSMTYTQIVLVRNDVKDTLLKITENPLTILGNDIDVAEHSMIGAGVQVSGLTDPENTNSVSSLNTQLEVKYQQSVDISNWKQQVWKRMTGLFLLATGLIAALIFLFYLVFRTLIKQKRIVDVTTDFANNMTHELKTPLSSMAIIIKSLAKDAVRSQPALMDDLICSLERQHHKLQQLTNQVMETALAEERSPKREMISMPGFLEQTVQDFKNDTHNVELSISETDCVLETDPGLLGSILENLLDNAVKYSEPGTTIRLKAHAGMHHYIIEISDQGKGIAMAEQARIFEKFYRVPEKDLHSVKGMGLGLYLCRKRVGMLGGSLSVRSQPGKGSVFIIKIPLREN